MNIERLWAAVEFTAQNGSTEALLTAAAAAGLHLTGVRPLPGGFCGFCGAGRYRRLAGLARRRRVRLRVRRRCGLYFRIRPLLRRTGLWVGAAVFLPLLLWSQGMIWAVDGSTLTTGQQARAAAVLRTVDLAPGSRVSEEKLAAGEYALLQSGEFSWASLNFLDGRLIVEAAAAKQVPEIFSGTLHGLRAKAAGTVVETNLVSGTMLVTPGQQVEAGQGLIGTARAERDGTLIFEPAAGTVTARLDWSVRLEQPLQVTSDLLTGDTSARYELLFRGRRFSLPGWRAAPEGTGRTVVRYVQAELGCFVLPLTLQETTFYATASREVSYPEETALALARLHGLQALAAAYPDAEILDCKEDALSLDGTLHYTAVYTITANICGE